jgi:hypothetical protein
MKTRTMIAGKAVRTAVAFWRRRAKAPVVASALLATLLIGGPAQARDSIAAFVNVQQPKKLASEEWRSISYAARRILKHVDQALDALAEGKTDLAATNIGQGLKLVQIVDAALPASKVKTEIKAGALTYTDQSLSKPSLVPIFREFDRVDELAMIDPKAAGARVGQSAAKRPYPEYTYSGLEYSAVKLNIKLTKRDLLSAQNLIKKNDVKAARSALDEILWTGPVFEYSSADLPLTRAADNLRLAESEFKDHRVDEARAALSAASFELKGYVTGSGKTSSKDVEKLRSEIEQVAKELGRQTPATLSKRIADWWGRVTSTASPTCTGLASSRHH